MSIDGNSGLVREIVPPVTERNVNEMVVMTRFAFGLRYEDWIRGIRPECTWRTLGQDVDPLPRAEALPNTTLRLGQLVGGWLVGGQAVGLPEVIDQVGDDRGPG